MYYANETFPRTFHLWGGERFQFGHANRDANPLNDPKNREPFTLGVKGLVKGLLIVSVVIIRIYINLSPFTPIPRARIGARYA